MQTEASNRRQLGDEESLLSFVEAQLHSPFALNSTHQHRLKFLLAQVKQLEVESVKSALRRIDFHKADSTYESIWAVHAAQIIDDQELLSRLVDEHPSSTIQRKAAKALARLGAAEALTPKLFGQQLSHDMKCFILGLLPSLATEVSGEVLELTATLRSPEAAACLACRRSTQPLIEKFTIHTKANPLANQNAKVRHAVKAALGRFPKLAQVWLSWHLCPGRLQAQILEIVGKKRHLERSEDGEPSMFELFTRHSHLDTKWFLQKYVPAAVEAVQTEYHDGEKNQAKLYLPVCQAMDFFDETFLWYCKSRVKIDPCATMDLIQAVADKRPKLLSHQMDIHRENTCELAQLLSRSLPKHLTKRRKEMSVLLMMGLVERDHLAGTLQNTELSAYRLFASMPLRFWSPEQLKDLLVLWPRLVPSLSLYLPSSTVKRLNGPEMQCLGLKALRLYFHSEEFPSTCKDWNDIDISQSVMEFLHTHDRDLWEYQVQRIKGMTKKYEIEKAPEWFKLQLPYAEVEKCLKQECRGKDAMGPQRVSKFRNLIESAFHSGDKAIADVLKFLTNTMKTERDDNRGEILESLFEHLASPSALHRTHPQERLWGDCPDHKTAVFGAVPTAPDTPTATADLDEVISVADSLSSEYSFLEGFSEKISLSTHEPSAPAEGAQSFHSPWFLRESHIPYLERLLMFNLQAKGTSGNSSKAWQSLAVRLMSRAIGFGQGPSSKMMRFGSGILRKLVACKIITEEVRSAQLMQVHTTVARFPFGKRERNLSDMTKFAIQAAKTIKSNRGNSSSLLYTVIFCEEFPERDRAQCLRELLSYEKNFGMLVHRKRQDLLNCILETGAEEAIPHQFNPNIAKTFKTDAKAMKDNVQQKMVAQFYEGLPFLSASPEVLKTLWMWHPAQQKMLYENWIMPVINDGERFELSAQVRSNVIETSSCLDLVDERLSTVESTLQSCSDGLQDETLEPAQRGLIGRLGEDLIMSLGHGDRAQACCEILVKHSFSGISKMAVVQLGMVLKRVGLTTIAKVIDAIVKDKSIRLGGKVALAKLTVALDIPEPGLLLKQWEDGECHREVGVALLTSLLERPHLTQAYPVLLGKPMQDLQASLLALEASRTEDGKTDEDKDSSPYLTVAFLTFARDNMGYLQDAWLQSEVGTSFLRFAATVAASCRGKLRETSIEVLASVFYSKRPYNYGIGSSELTLYLPAAYPAAAEALETVFTDCVKRSMEHIWVYEHAANLLFALSQSKHAGLDLLNKVLRIVAAGYDEGMRTANRQAVERCAVIAQKLCNGAAQAGLLLVHGGSDKDCFNFVCQKVVEPLVSQEAVGPVEVMAAAALWSCLLTFEHSSAEQTAERVFTFCLDSHKALPRELHKEMAEQIARGLTTQSEFNRLLPDKLALLKVLSMLLENAEGLRGSVAQKMLHSLLQLDHFRGLSKAEAEELRRLEDGVSLSRDLSIAAEAFTTYLQRNSFIISSDPPRKAPGLLGTQSLSHSTTNSYRQQAVGRGRGGLRGGRGGRGKW